MPRRNSNKATVGLDSNWTSNKLLTPGNKLCHD